jgi:methionyl-tRNA formyltransferase
MKKIYNIAYAGLDSDTWFLLAGEPLFAPKIAALMPNLLEHPTRNPCNILLKYAYRQYATGGHANVFLWSYVLRMCSPLLTSAWRKYYRFIISTVQQKVEVVDFENAAHAIASMQRHAIDLLVVNVWGLLPAEVIDTPVHKTVNIHPSKLPQYQGAVPTLMTLKNHDSESAVSYMVLDKTVDGGDLIGQHIFSVSSADTYYTIEQKIAHIVENTLLHDLKTYLAGGNRPVRQGTVKQSATPRYYAYMRVDWQTESAVDIYNKVNAYPYIEAFDYCHTLFRGKKVVLKRAKIVQKEKSFPARPGYFSLHGNTLHISTFDGELAFRLFRDIDFKDSLRFVIARKGQLTNEDKP